jgi:16S rRNA (uracil1498-N3)-methyltransferase
MPAPRLHVDTTLSAELEFSLPDNAARHVQVLRLQPGAELSLFDGQGGEWAAQVLEMGRREVRARVLAHRALECELQRPVTLALGMPANERMDSLVEKATELGAATIQPLVCERSVLRLAGDRAERKAAHWQAVAVAACEQSGRNRVPVVAPPIPLRDWLVAIESDSQSERLMLSLDVQARPLLRQLDVGSLAPLVFLSGPEGGLSPNEQALAGQHRFQPVTLGPRTLRADTAPLAALACIAALEGR